MFDTKKTKVIFWGTPEFSVPSFFELIQANYDIVAVITQPDKPVGRKQTNQESAVKKAALKYKIPVIQPENVKNNSDFTNKLIDLKPDLSIVVAYGQIIPQEILDIPKFGFINIHGSLLPKLRGASPMQSAILEELDKTGITIMRMSAKMDDGDILSQKSFVLNSDTTISILHDQLKQLGADLLIKTIPEYILGNIEPIQQDETKATYCTLITKEMGKVELENDEPKNIYKKFRAFHPWPGIWTTYKNKRLKILDVALFDNKISVRKVQLEGKKPVNWEDFKRGN